MNSFALFALTVFLSLYVSSTTAIIEDSIIIIEETLCFLYIQSHVDFPLCTSLVIFGKG